jgi:Ca2+-transporting ATPase
VPSLTAIRRRADALSRRAAHDGVVAPDVAHVAHALDHATVARLLDSDAAVGLTDAEAARRLARYGPNRLARPPRPAYARILARQLVDPLVGLLVVAAVVSVAVGETLEALVIGAIVVLNAVLGFVMEAGAAREVLALHSALELDAVVVRDGTERHVEASGLVPGDLVRIREGDRVGADARLVHTHGLEVDESLLTGESVPVGKAVAAVPDSASLAERASVVYAGTGVTRGSALALVVATGADTEQGHIAELVQEAEPPRTPLQQRLGSLARALVVAGAGVTVLLAALMLARGEPAQDAFLVGVSVAVAAVPEGLAATLTIALALGSREMARRRAIVRTLSAIETIGETTVVCADKTGTLTENRLRVQSVEPSAGADVDRVLSAARAASAEETDPVDRALADAARERGLNGSQPIVRALPFSPELRRAAVVVETGTGLRGIVKGAPEVVLSRCGGFEPECERLLVRAEALAAGGARVLALAERTLAEADDDLDSGLEPLGIVALADPLREDAASAVADARGLGLRVEMLTGDHPLTAAAVGARLGLSGDEVHSRFTPADKLALVRHRQLQGEVVAVTGDGVNDAPALRQADVGIAMGLGGTEAAREASTLVLTDDAFSTIVAAVREGRRIGANVRSFLAFLLSANVGEVVLFAIAVGASLGVPMTVVQVLVVNLLTDGLPAVALAADRASGGRVGLVRGAPLLGRRLVVALLAVGGLVGAVSLGSYLAVRELRPEAAQTAAFATVALAELALVFSCRSELLPSWRLPPNRPLRAAVVGSLGIVLALLYLPFAHEPFGTVSLDAAELGIVVALALLPAVAAEAAKAAARGRRPGPVG